MLKTKALFKVRIDKLLTIDSTECLALYNNS
ncbi:MAG: hypothetical protein ACI84C_003001 [Flavobacteriales bacterium]|jgi:hypothetical protein